MNAHTRFSTANDHEWTLDARVGGRAQTLEITVNSDLITQYTPGAHPEPGPRKQLEGISDAEGFPIVFFIDPEQRGVEVVYHDRDRKPGEAEFKRAVITDRLLAEQFCERSDLNIPRYAVVQEPDGRFKLLVEIHDGNASRVFATAPLSNQVGPGWLDGLRRFEARGEAFVGNTAGLLLGDSDLVGNPRYGALEIVSSHGRGELRHYHWVPAGLESDPDAGGRWREFSLPFNATQLVAMVPARGIDGHGVYAATEINGKQSLTFVCLVDVDGRLVNHTTALSVPTKITALAAAPGNAEGDTDLYIAGADGLWCHKAERLRTVCTSAAAIRLTRPEELDNARWLAARADAEGVSLIALHGDGELSRLVRPLELGELERLCAIENDDYLSPVPIYYDLAEVNLIRGRASVGESLLLVDREQNLIRYEHGHSSWTPTNIPVPARTKLNEIKSYTVQVSVDRRGGLPLVSESDERFVPASFELGCEETVEVQVNGEHLRVGPNNRAVVRPDSAGKLAIVWQVDSPAAPAMTLRCAYFNQVLTLNPAHKLEQRLHSYQSADSMRKDLVDAEGNSLIKHPGNLDAAYDATTKLQQINNKLRLAANLMTLPEADASADEVWGISIVDGVATFYEGEAGLARMDASEDWFTKALRAAASDALRWIEARLRDAAQIIVRGAEFAVKIGEQAFRFVIDSGAKLFEAFKVLLKNVLGLDLDAMFKWIGFIFQWKDVVTTYKVFSNVAYQSFEYVEAKLDELGKLARGKLDELERLIAEAVAKVTDSPELQRLNLLDDRENGRQHETEETRAASRQISKTAAGNFGAHHLQTGGMLNVDGRGALSCSAFAFDPEQLLATLPPETAALLENGPNEIVAWFKRLGGTIAKLYTALGKLVSGQRVTIRELVEALGELGTLFIQAARASLDVGIALLTGAVKSFKALLFSPIEVPFLTPMFKHLLSLGGAGQLPERFGLNAVNATLLLTVIPATFTFKLLTNRSPFHDQDGTPRLDGLDSMGHAKLFAALQSGGLSRRTYTDYRNLSQLTSTVLTTIESGAAAVAALAGTTIPAILNLPLDMARVACTLPIGKFGLGKLGGWIGNWVAVAANVYGVISPGPAGKVGAVLKTVLQVVFSGLVPTVGFFMSLAAIYDSEFPEPRRRDEHVANNLFALFCTLGAGSSKILINVAAFNDEPQTKAGILATGSALVAIANTLEVGRAGVVTLTDLTPLDALTSSKDYRQAMHDKSRADEQSLGPMLRTCNYRLYTMDGKFEEVARGQLHLEFGSGANSRIPITGIEMSMEGSGKTDPVLIPSSYDESARQLHVRLRGDGAAVNSVLGNLTRPVSGSQPIQFSGEYRHVGQPFAEILGEDWRYLFMLALQEDASACADADGPVHDPLEIP